MNQIVLPKLKACLTYSYIPERQEYDLCDENGIFLTSLKSLDFDTNVAFVEDLLERLGVDNFSVYDNFESAALALKSEYLRNSRNSNLLALTAYAKHRVVTIGKTFVVPLA